MHALDCRILQLQSQDFSGDDSPGLCKSAPGASTQTPISVRLSSFSIVSFSQKDHCEQALFHGINASRQKKQNPLKIVVVTLL